MDDFYFDGATPKKPQAASPATPPSSSDTESTPSPSVQDHGGEIKNVVDYKSEWGDDFSKDVVTEMAALPSMLRRHFVEELALVRGAEITTDSDRNWLAIASAASDMAPGITTRAPKDGEVSYDLFERALSSVEREWRQRIDDIMAKPRKVATGGKMTGKKAVQLARQTAKLGTYFTCPLYHTGGQMTFVSPSDNEIVRLVDRMTNDLEELGRRTNGMFLSAEVAYLQETLFNFALTHMDECTIKHDDFEDLKNKINFLDIPHVIWGVAGSIWSKGFRYMGACMHDHNVCRHVSRGSIDLRRIQRVDTKSVPAWALHQVLSQVERESVTQPMLDRYRNENPRLAVLNKDIIEGIQVEFSTCSVNEYFSASRRWITSLEETFVDAMQLEGQERAKLLTTHAKASSARQYTHLVKSITIADGGKIDDREVIEELLTTLSGSDEFRENFFTQVADYVENATISILGLRVKNCPSCGNPQIPKSSLRNYPGIIPINVVRLFFFLYPQRETMIKRR